MHKIAVIYGTRPEIIKLAPVIRELKKNKSFITHSVNTGQHLEMVEDAEKMLSITPDFSFNIMKKNQNLNDIMINVLSRMNSYLEEENPDIVVVQGDTTTVLAAGICCFNRGIKVAHVEAGLRSNDLTQPYPEEFNRRVISIFAEFNFVPTTLSRNNLLKEGLNSNKIFLTGNTIVDAVNWAKEQYSISGSVDNGRRNILITAHRRENHGIGIEHICEAVRTISSHHPDITFNWPVHPNPNVRDVVYQKLKGLPNVKLSDPLNYPDMIKLMNNAWLIWSDSGGIQEEATALKKPVLILRELTERPEVVDSGFGIIVGTDIVKIVNATEDLLTNPQKYNSMISGANPFGDGTASKQIAKILAAHFENVQMNSPK